MRTVLSILILLAVVGWIVLSYVPKAAASLPVLAFPAGLTSGLFPILAGLSLAAFLALQVWLVRDTDVAVEKWRRHSASRAEPFRLKRSAELVWTALPIALTLALAVASYRWWTG